MSASGLVWLGCALLALTVLLAILPTVRQFWAIWSLGPVAQVQAVTPPRASKLLGPRFGTLFAQTVDVHFSSQLPFRGEHIRLLRWIPHLDEVSFRACQLEREHLEALASLPHIPMLTLAHARISNDAAPVFARLRNVDALRLSPAELDDSVVDALSQLPCPSLKLAYGRVTNRCLHAIGKMERLESLDLSYTRIGGAAFRHISRLEHLQTLNLEATDFDDVSAEWISEMTALRRLNLGYTLITDAGAQNLAALPALDSVSLVWTRVTPEGWSRVSSAIPRCRAQLGQVTR